MPIAGITYMATTVKDGIIKSTPTRPHPYVISYQNIYGHKGIRKEAAGGLFATPYYILYFGP